jgi:mono/diheme cytochrome c family protein
MMGVQTMKHVVAGTVVLMAGLASQAASAQSDLAVGLRVATQICSECHAVEKGQVRSPNSRSPTFMELARVPGMTEAALTVALTTPHAGMPMFILTPEQRAGVIAYILSLKE